MLDGLGMAETTPGPLIMVVQFVGFLAAFRDPGSARSLRWRRCSAAVLVTWVTFTAVVPVDLPRRALHRAPAQQSGLRRRLAAITAAVVGVILNLAIWFAVHTIFGRVVLRTAGALRIEVPDPASLDLAAAVLTVAALLAVFRWRLGMAPLLLIWAAAGIGWQLLAGAG